jgi:A/G-specific adenine glycosylase
MPTGLFRPHCIIFEPMNSPTAAQIRAFRRKILRFYSLHGRKLPFRRTADPYKITVAEIMLQQTQVDRVIPKYLDWIRTWPDWKSLARASDRQLLTAWSGLGYNRRCLYLGKLARAVIQEFDGKLPDDPEVLVRLPGLGPYTSRAILIFAFNRPLATIDTNVRRVLLHEFSLPADTPRKAFEALAEGLVPPKRARDWHNALMDYGALALPRKLADIPQSSRQSPFQGSLRQIRGEIVRRLTTQASVSIRTVACSLDRGEADVLRAARALEKEGIVRLSRRVVRLRNPGAPDAGYRGRRPSRPTSFRRTRHSS